MLGAIGGIISTIINLIVELRLNKDAGGMSKFLMITAAAVIAACFIFSLYETNNAKNEAAAAEFETASVMQDLCTATNELFQLKLEIGSLQKSLDAAVDDRKKIKQAVRAPIEGPFFRMKTNDDKYLEEFSGKMTFNLTKLKADAIQLRVGDPIKMVVENISDRPVESFRWEARVKHLVENTFVRGFPENLNFSLQKGVRNLGMTSDHFAIDVKQILPSRQNVILPNLISSGEGKSYIFIIFRTTTIHGTAEFHQIYSFKQ